MRRPLSAVPPNVKAKPPLRNNPPEVSCNTSLGLPKLKVPVPVDTILSEFKFKVPPLNEPAVIPVKPVIFTFDVLLATTPLNVFASACV